MKISKEDILRINKGFGGNLRNDASVDFALEAIKNPKLGVYKRLAYMLRAILVDHPFSDGNKRTAMFLCLHVAEEHKKYIDRDLLLEQIVSIAKHNINEIRNIEWRIKNCIR